MSLLLILALGGLMHAARSFQPEGTMVTGTTIAFGFVLLTAFFAGRIFYKIRLPKLTGYIAAGIVVGPAVLGLISPGMVEDLGIVNGVAIALIALTAGNELDLRAFRPLLGTIFWITLFAVVGTALLLGVTAFAIRGYLPFMADMPLPPAIAAEMVIGVVMADQSPAVVVALRDELRADGPVARTVLGVVVIADLVVILLFAATSSLAKPLFDTAGGASDTLGKLTWEILGSLTSGVLVGALIALYLRFVGRRGASLFIVTTCFVVAMVGAELQFDPLLVALAAGVLVRNTTKQGDVLHHEIDLASLPVYVVFFAVAGAQIDLGVFAVVGIPAAIFVTVRGFGLVTGSKIGAKMAKAPEVVQRYAGMGLLPQAGLALALSMLFARTFPNFGAEARALTLGVVALNEIIAPAIYRWALVRSGEAGKRDTAGQEDEEPTELPGRPPESPADPALSAAAPTARS
jgi:Kef-type K+ transport system membrane component KefB